MFAQCLPGNWRGFERLLEFFARWSNAKIIEGRNQQQHRGNSHVIYLFIWWKGWMFGKRTIVVFLFLCWDGFGDSLAGFFERRNFWEFGVARNIEFKIFDFFLLYFYKETLKIVFKTFMQDVSVKLSIILEPFSFKVLLHVSRLSLFTI